MELLIYELRYVIQPKMLTSEVNETNIGVKYHTLKIKWYETVCLCFMANIMRSNLLIVIGLQIINQLFLVCKRISD